MGARRTELGEVVGKRRVTYRSYLLRLSQVSDPREGAPWRATVERVQDGQRLSFASLDELFDFLRQETGSGACSPGGRERERG